MHTIPRALAASAFLAVAATFSSPAVTGLYNTGVDNAGVPLADDALDAHYTVVFPSAGVTYAATSAGGFPIPPWIGDNTTSAWISPFRDTSGVFLQLYTFETTFTLAPSEVAGFTLGGQWAGDDGGVGDDIRINGSSTGLSATGGFTSWTPFSITSGFVAGLNTLQFDMVNRGGGPIGIRVEFTVIPETGSAVWLGAGLALVGGAVAARRRAARRG